MNTRTDELRIPQPRRQNLANSVAKVLKRYILLERLEPGDRLPAERRLAEALNVSRTVLREALGQLIGEGIVERAPRAIQVRAFDRSRVSLELAPIDEDDAEVRDLIELRALIEIGAIETIIARATDDDLQEIERWVVACEQNLAAQELMVWSDAGFHASLLRVLDNRSVNAFIPVIEEARRRQLYINPFQLGHPVTERNQEAAREHRALLESIRRKDVVSAREIIASHVSYYIRDSASVGRLVPETLNQADPSEPNRE